MFFIYDTTLHSPNHVPLQNTPRKAIARVKSGIVFWNNFLYFFLFILQQFLSFPHLNRATEHDE